MHKDSKRFGQNIWLEEKTEQLKLNLALNVITFLLHSPSTLYMSYFYAAWFSLVQWDLFIYIKKMIKYIEEI